jgi:hypothetical protein
MYRGTCDFIVKVRNAQTAGAILVLVALITNEPLFPMGTNTDASSITTPSVLISRADGAVLTGDIAEIRFAMNPVLCVWLILPPSVISSLVFHCFFLFSFVSSFLFFLSLQIGRSCSCL